jgi:type IV secretory pathway TraG/TraD family ATPase VirD4
MDKLMMWLVQWIWLFVKALTLTVTAPVLIYRGFAGASYHWLQWLALFFAVQALYAIGAGYWHHGADTGTIALPFAVALAWSLSTQAATVLDRFRASPLSFLAWRPMVGGADWAPPMGSGAAKADETLLRGAAIVDGRALEAQLYRKASPAELAQLIELGGVHVPYKSEAEHFLIEGKTGAGKTQAINAMLRTVRRRNQPAIIADPAGGYLGRFYQPDRDVILNPFDARSVAWNPFAEIRADWDFQRIAKAAIPDTSGDAQEWHFYAQSLLGETMRALHKQGVTSIKRLLYFVQSAEQRELAELLTGTPAAVVTQRGNEKMLSNTRAIAALYLSVWTYLPEGGSFSVRDWVSGADSNNGGWLYLTYRDDQMAMLKNLVATFLELAIVEGLSLSEKPDRRV